MARSLPDREELGARSAAIRFAPFALTGADVAPFRLAGAWALTSDDPRIRGVSALALERGRFIAVTDSGVIVHFSKPSEGRSVAAVNELPGGPESGRFKENRDSEALVVDPLGRGWWVAFENRNALWLYDREFTRALKRVALGDDRWPFNLGIEGLATEGGNALLLFPEAGDSVIRWTGGSGKNLRLDRPRGRISDAARLPDGRLVVVHRHPTLLGFANAITLIERTAGGGHRMGRSYPLRGLRLGNVEAIAAERLEDGRTRLWLMTDDNFQRPLRTLLIALDVPRDLER